jgi:hypothetical protein
LAAGVLAAGAAGATGLKPHALKSGSVAPLARVSKKARRLLE